MSYVSRSQCLALQLAQLVVQVWEQILTWTYPILERATQIQLYCVVFAGWPGDLLQPALPGTQESPGGDLTAGTQGALRDEVRHDQVVDQCRSRRRKGIKDNTNFYMLQSYYVKKGANIVRWQEKTWSEVSSVVW